MKKEKNRIFLKKLINKLLSEDNNKIINNNSNITFDFLLSKNNIEILYKKDCLLSMFKNEDNYDFDISDFDNVYEATGIYSL